MIGNVILHSTKRRFVITNSSFYQSGLETVKDVKDGETSHPSPLQTEYKQVIAP